MQDNFFAEEIVRWYHKHQRNLPWRHTRDPYIIWLSEIILQQTRVAQGMPYFHSFIEAFPTVYDLAKAPQDQVLRLWQGLGYYSRARNLHACAQEIVNEHGGEFPRCYQELLRLKGVGEYTAAAIASFAFNETVPVVDGNVYRVLSRVFGIKDDIRSSRGQKRFRKQAEALVPEGEANVYNQAIMEFGALQCTPTNPACLLCPLNSMCYAYQHGQQQTLPVKAKKAKPRARFLHYLVICYDDKIWMRQRDTRGIWAGLYDFYLIEVPQSSTLDSLDDPLLKSLLEQDESITVETSMLYQHTLSHQQLHVLFHTITLSKNLMSKVNCLQAYSVQEIEALPKPILIDNFLQKEIF